MSKTKAPTPVLGVVFCASNLGGQIAPAFIETKIVTGHVAQSLQGVETSTTCTVLDSDTQEAVTNLLLTILRSGNNSMTYKKACNYLSRDIIVLLTFGGYLVRSGQYVTITSLTRQTVRESLHRLSKEFNASCVTYPLKTCALLLTKKKCVHVWGRTYLSF